MHVVPPTQRPPQGSAASKHAAARLRRLCPCPGRRPAAVEMGLQKEMEIHMPKLGPDGRKGSARHRDALMRVDKAKRVIVEITYSAAR